jgi:hypothetical protein
MDKRALQVYAIWAKEELERQIKQSLKLIGINSQKDIKQAKIQGDVMVIHDDPNSYSKEMYNQRQLIIRLIENNGFEHTIEEFSYTWFNRLIALRFLEVHDYLPHGFRVLSSRDGSIEPEILKNLPLVASDLKLDLKYAEELKHSGKIEELFRYVLFRQGKALSNILPMLFGEDSDYLELLLPKALLKGTTVVTNLVAINEDNFKDDVEVIGWLYQFYISIKKDEVNESKATIVKDTIPAVTQLFTPDWIVRYLTENSLGRVWLESYPNSSIKNNLKYFIEDEKQTNEVEEQLEKIKYKDVQPEHIKVIDPCCGSGHILVYAFDLLYEMYLEKGILKRDIPRLMLENNLFGLDIDKRASQLASFALTMKARKYDPRFFEAQRLVLPHVYEIEESNSLPYDFINQLKNLKIIPNNELEIIKYVYDTFRDAKLFGSLIKVQPRDYDSAIKSLHKALEPVNKLGNLFTQDLLYSNIPTMISLLFQAKVFANKYDVMITNPPYLSTTKMEENVKKFAQDFYPRSKTDMFAMFMETDFVKENGLTAMINMHSWMFLSTYENLRENFINNRTIINMLHLGTRAFETINGDIVQTTAFVFKKKHFKYQGVFIRLVDFTNYDEKRLKTLESIKDNKCIFKFTATTDTFNLIPSLPLAYWVNNTLLNTFKLEKIFSKSYSPSQNITGNNKKYLRFFWEIDRYKIGKQKGWIFYAKGGGYRKWYGNTIDVINWTDSARKDYQSGHGSQIIKEEYWYKKVITWGLISTDNPSFRMFDCDGTFDKGGSSIIITENKYYNYILGYLNTNVALKILKLYNPTVNFQVKDIRDLPINYDAEQFHTVTEVVQDCIDISKVDWDSYETSWDFSVHPLIKHNKSNNINNACISWNNSLEELNNRINNNELKLNKIFIELYNLQQDINAFDDIKITISQPNIERDIKSLLLYFVGIVMGRFSIKEKGLIYAGGLYDESKYGAYKPIEDGIVPLYEMNGINGDLTSKVLELNKIVFGEENYKLNVDFIAEAIGKKTSESSYDAIHRYLLNDLYNDHLKMYQKRPIYWMFSSGKNNAFKCLVYLHRYNKNTLANINTRYLLNHTARLKNELDNIEHRLLSADIKEKVKLEKDKKIYTNQFNELIEYGQVLEHKANEFISLDLDDGVAVNYEKFQGIEVATNSGIKIKKDLLEKIK